MKRIFPIDRVAFARRVLALVGCTVALASLTLVPAAAQAPTEEQLRALEAQLLVLVNQARAQAGLRPYTVSSQLSDAARRHSLDMATHNFFSSNGSDGSDWPTRIQETGYQGSSLGENIFAGVATAEAALNSGRATILTPDFTEIGVAVAYNANSRFGYYWTMDFGGVRPPTEEQLRAVEAQLLVLANQAREQVGVSPLAWSNELAAAARRHSQDMATNNFVNYVGSDGSLHDTRVRDAGYKGTYMGEQIFPSAATAEEALKFALGGNILDPVYTEIGVAVAYNANTQYGYYWTMDFGRR